MTDKAQNIKQITDGVTSTLLEKLPALVAEGNQKVFIDKMLPEITKSITAIIKDGITAMQLKAEAEQVKQHTELLCRIEELQASVNKMLDVVSGEKPKAKTRTKADEVAASAPTAMSSTGPVESSAKKVASNSKLQFTEQFKSFVNSQEPFSAYYSGKTLDSIVEVVTATMKDSSVGAGKAGAQLVAAQSTHVWNTLSDEVKKDIKTYWDELKKGKPASSDAPAEDGSKL
jgi:hypothetical protein